MRAERIEREAADWLAARDAGPLTLEREAALQAWLAQSDRHGAAFVRLQTCWDQANRFRRLRTPDQPVNLDLLQGAQRVAGSRPWVWLAAAAGVLVATFVLFGAYQSWGTQVYRTPVGGLARIPLADGSVITLNTASEVWVEFTAHRRTVRLLKGEAQFTVAHDPHRAFDVRVGEKTVRAVGTVFSVRWFGGDDVKVIVTSGRVAIVPTVTLAEIPVSVLPPSIPTIHAGESAEVGPHDALKVRELGATAEQTVSWTQGRLWFDRITLREAVAEINRYNRRQFVIDDPTLADLHIGGTFDAADVESFEAALRSFGMQVDESDPDTLRLSKAPQS